jgi:hypothetical protein
MWIQDGCKVYMDSYITSNGPHFMVTWTISNNHLLESGLTQNHWETMALRTLTTIYLLLFIMIRGPTWIEIHWNSIWLRAQSHMASHYTWGSVTTLHDFGGVLGWPWNTFFWALTISWSHGSWVVCDITLRRLRLINGYVVEYDNLFILMIPCAVLFMVFSGMNNSEFHCAITFHYRSRLNTIKH